MAEREALTAAVLADPDDDLPRLVFADWLDERGEAARARFIRAQLALAALPEWDPQSAALRRTRPEWDCSEESIRTLPPLTSDTGLHWNAREPFRRGFGYAVQAPHLRALQFRMPALLAEEPVGRLGLYGATLDQWQEFAAAPWLPRIREIDFEGIGAPIEAMRELLASPGNTGLHTLRFGSAVSAGMPTVLERLMRSPVGDRLRALSIAQAFGSDESYFEDFLEAFHIGLEKLESLSLRSMGFGGQNYTEFLTARRWENLAELAIADAEPGAHGLSFLGYPDCWPQLTALRLETVNLGRLNPDHLANSLRAPRLAVLDLRNSWLSAQAFQAIAKAEHLAELRVVRLRRMTLDNRGARYISRAKFWRNLVELDLCGNPIDENGAKHLLTRKPPEQFELLRIDDRFPEEFRGRVGDHFEGKVLFEQVAR